MEKVAQASNPWVWKRKNGFLLSFGKYICWKWRRRDWGDHQHLWKLSNTIYYLNQGFLSSQVCAFYPIVFLSFPWTVWKISCIFSCIVQQVFKILHRYVHFIPMFFYLFHGLFERFLAYFFDYFFAYLLHISLLFVFTILPLISMRKKMKNSPNVNGGFKKLEWKIEWKIATLFFLSFMA